MFKPLICYLFVFSMLFMSVEGAYDASSGEHPHHDSAVHTVDSGTPSLDAHDGEGQCSDCCHGHASSITGHLPKSLCESNVQQIVFFQPHFKNIPQAPPTPPPNV